MLKNLILDKLYSDLYQIILSYLPFTSLTLIAEADNNFLTEDFRATAESILKNSYPKYINLPNALAKQEYALLIDNLMADVMPLLSNKFIPKARAKTKIAYKELCEKLGPAIRYFIISYLSSSHAKSELNPIILHDVAFHYCQYNPEEAGQWLNKNYFHFWNRNIYYFALHLIEYGALVNTVWNDSQPTLFHAITFNSSEAFIRALINHGGDYSAYSEIRHGAKYTYMLIAALNKNLEALPVLIEKFPQEIEPTLETLAWMLSRNSDTEFPYESGIYKTYSFDSKCLNSFYSVKQISLAKELILKRSNANNKNQKKTPVTREFNQAKVTPTSSFNNPRYLGLFSHPASNTPIEQTVSKPHSPTPKISNSCL